MPVHTPGSIGSSGPDDQGTQLDNAGVKFPNSVDALPNYQYPDMPGGPDGNAPISPDQQAHYPTVRVAATMVPNYPGTEPAPIVGSVKSSVPAMPQYGTSLNTGTSYQTQSEE